MVKNYIKVSLAVLAVAGSVEHLAAQSAKGIVFEDTNGNQKYDPEEAGVAGVRVSNGMQIIETDANGAYELPVTDDTILFVIKPDGYQVPLNEENLPQFYYNHKPSGSPELKYAGVEPTGPLPNSVDFPLRKVTEPEEFKILLFADTQPRNVKEIQYIQHDIIEELIGADASFGVTLGDILFDDLDLFPLLSQSIARIGIPWYNVLGNHDINFDATHDRYSDETFERFFGPPYYSFDYAGVHFIVLDDVNYYPVSERNDKNTKYRGGLGPEQLVFLQNDLELIERDQMVVVLMHIPLTAGWVSADRRQLFRLLEPLENCISISGHTHFQEHQFLGQKDGWKGAKEHHHIINVTVSGSWWSGVPDEEGIPHTTMRDGAPNGYTIMTLSGDKYSTQFKAARRPADHQMTIFAPERVRTSAKVPVTVNLFAGSKYSTVKARFAGEDEWVTLVQTPGKDPYFQKLKSQEKEYESLPGRKLPGIRGDTPHLWKGSLSAPKKVGATFIEVKADLPHDRTYMEERIITIE